MNQMPCSNTAALNRYMSQQDRLDAKEAVAEQHQENIRIAAQEIVLKKIGFATEEAKEAVHGEEFTDGDYAVISAIMSCILSADREATKEEHRATLGNYIFNKFFDYLLTDEVKEQAEREILGEI